VAVAEARGVAPETLPPLYDATDTEAVERLFAPCCDGAPRADGHAAFRRWAVKSPSVATGPGGRKLEEWPPETGELVAAVSFEKGNA